MSIFPIRLIIWRLIAQLGERVVVEGMQGEPDEVLSSKKGKDPLVAVSPVRNYFLI